MLTATKKKIVYLIAVTATVLALLSAPASVSTAFAGDCDGSTSGTCGGG